jgi:UrcA family protein
MRNTLMIALSMAALTAPAPAMAAAADGDQVRTVTVSKKGVDLADAGQARKLYARLKRAANAACSIESADPTYARPDAHCVAEALGRAVRSADKPLLTAAYQSDAASSNHALAGNDQ